MPDDTAAQDLDLTLILWTAALDISGMTNTQHWPPDDCEIGGAHNLWPWMILTSDLDVSKLILMVTEPYSEVIQLGYDVGLGQAQRYFISL